MTDAHNQQMFLNESSDAWLITSRTKPSNMVTYTAIHYETESYHENSDCQQFH
jgi:hypothetical protein